MKISLLIIAGGKSSRLGSDKRFVEVGGVGLLENILRKTQAFDFAEIFLCVEEKLPAIKFLAEKFAAKILVDKIKNSGPLAGITNGLAQINSDWALVISADMPFFNFEILQPLTEKFSSTQAIIPVVEKKIQPLAAFYKKNLAEFFSQELLSGQRKILSAIKKIPHEFLEIKNAELFFNVNTPADLKLARGRAENISRSTPIISVTAPNSGTGKTTFIERLIKIFSSRGKKIGVIKSDAHGFNLDVDGKDSHRFQIAGAKSVAVVSPKKYFLIQEIDERENFFTVAKKITGVDLILTESRTKNFFPTIFLCRGNREIFPDENIVAIFSSSPTASDEIAQFNLNDFFAAENICKFLAGW